MASANADKQRQRRRSWRKRTGRLSRRLFCCTCLPCEDREDPPEEMKINGDPQHPQLDDRRSGEKEAIQITVEDLGIVNSSFSLHDEEPLTPRTNVGRSASSVSACAWALKKRGLRPLSSLTIQPQSEPSSSRGDETEEEDEEDDPMLYESGTDGTPASGSLLLPPLPPVITLIPPTPSDVVDDDQFFDVNSEESVTHTSGSDGSVGAAEQETFEDKIDSGDVDEAHEGVAPKESGDECDNPAEVEEAQSGRCEGEGEAVATEEKPKTKFLRSAYQVAPLPGLPQTRSFNAGINLLAFTELNLDDLSNRDVTCPETLKSELRLLPQSPNMDAVTHQRRQITRSGSREDKLSRSATFHALTHNADLHQEEEGSPRQRRTTIASYVPQSKDQNGNFAEKDVDRQVAKCLRELSTDELCQWFASIGLHKCLPSIKEAKLCGADMASVDVNTLDVLQVTALEDREQLLSAIYNELHPPSTISQRLDSLLESSPTNVETFTAALASMSKSMSAPHVSCLALNRRSIQLRNNSQNCMVPRNSQLLEITINAAERIVHLRTPKETTVGKIMDSCIKMLGVTEDKSLFALKEKQDSSGELAADQQIGSLLTSTTEKRQLELHLCKTEKTTTNSSQSINANENDSINKNVQESRSAKEERIKELTQQVDSLHNVISQVQELHQSLVEFCSELKNMDEDADLAQLGSAELEQRLESTKGCLNEKRQSLRCLRDNLDNCTALKSKQSEVHLLEKMKLNCQVFKEEIFMVHLNRRVAHLQTALRESQERAQRKSGSLSQLVSPQSSAILLVMQENRGADGHFGFTCGHTEGSGYVVVNLCVDDTDTNLRVDDRLVEVNGMPVVNLTLEEVTDLLQQGPTAQIVVLRQPSPMSSPDCRQHLIGRDPVQTVCTQSELVTAETPPRRKVMAI